MKFYLWFTLVMMILSLLGKWTWFVKDQFPPRTQRETAYDILFGFVMLIWTFYLLWDMR